MKGYLREDGRKGIRNQVLIVYLVECAHYVADEIVRQSGCDNVQSIGFAGCAPNVYASKMLLRLCTHSNVGGVLLVSLGCENMDRKLLAEDIRISGRPVRTVVIQEAGGTLKAIEAGNAFLQEIRMEVANRERLVEFTFSDLIVGTICGGSDSTSGLTANPAVGLAFDELLRYGSTCLFEEPGELIGCEQMLANRAQDEELGNRLLQVIWKADRYYKEMGHDSFSMGNGEGGLTTIEEKSLGSYCKSGSSTINGILYPGDIPVISGLYLMDVVPDGEAKWGFPNPNDNAEIVEMIACGCHLLLFTTGRGSVVGSAISPVIKICANPYTYATMSADMDINAGKVISGETGLKEISSEIIALIEQLCSGSLSKSEALKHREFVLGYKSFKCMC